MSPNGIYSFTFNIIELFVSWIDGGCREEGPNAKRNHGHASNPRYPESRGSELLHQDESGQRRYCCKIHHSDNEQDQHQRPAAAEAVCAVAEPEFQCAFCAFPPVEEKKLERVPAFSEAFTFER